MNNEMEYRSQFGMEAYTAVNSAGVEEQLASVYKDIELYGSPKELCEKIQGLEAQLASLYEDIGKWGHPEELNTKIQGLEEQLAALYLEMQEWGRPEDLAHQVHGLNQQLQSFYDAQSEWGSISDLAAVCARVGVSWPVTKETARQIAQQGITQQSSRAVNAHIGSDEALVALRSLEEQLIALYQEKSGAANLEQTIHNLNCLVHALIEEKLCWEEKCVKLQNRLSLVGNAINKILVSE